MPTLYPPQSATYTVGSSSELVPVSCGTSDEMLVTWIGAAGVSGRQLVRQGSTVMLGPWPAGTVLTFKPVRGAPRYSTPATAGASQLPRWAAAVAAMQGGVRNARLLVVSDSTGAGGYAVGSQFSLNNFASSWPYQLAALFNAHGLATNIGSVFGDCTGSGSPTILMANDSRRVLSTDWLCNVLASTGGSVVSNAVAGSTTPYSFTPADPFDTVTVGAVGVGGYGKFSILIDGVVQGAVIDLNATTGQVFATRTFPLGNHTVSIQRSAATGADGIIPIQSIRCSNSTKPTIDIWNASTGGTDTNAQSDASAFYTPLSANAAMQPDMVLICLDINSWIGGMAPGTYDLATTTTHAYRLLSIVNALKPTADVVLMTGAPSASGSYAVATVQEPILQATRQIARIVNCPLVDIAQQWGSYTQASANGFYAPANDVVHPGAFGYSDIARNVSLLPGLMG